MSNEAGHLREWLVFIINQLACSLSDFEELAHLCDMQIWRSRLVLYAFLQV